MAAGEDLLKHVTNIKQYVRIINPNVTKAQVVDRLSDGLPSHLKAHFVEKLEHIETFN